MAKDNSNDIAVNKNISLYPNEWELIEMVNGYFGFRNRSQAVRHILREFDLQVWQETLAHETSHQEP